jgi:hypothetical protein
MPTAYELEQLQRKLARIETELAEAKRQLAHLTAHPVIPDSVPPVVTAGAAAVLPSPLEPPLLPPLLAPSFASAPPPIPAAAPGGPGGLRVWLASIGLWPPSGDANTEARLGAWWATRVGALLAVIGIVFFAIYVSQNTPPLVKLVELVAAALVVFFAGLRLERKVPRFGSVLAGAGLALLYFSAFAAYAVPATKVLAEPLTAAAVQLVVVALILGFAAWRRSETHATMAVGLGYVTAFFSGYAGMDAFALWSALALALGAVVLKFRPGCRAPSTIALPLAYLVYVVLAFSVWSRSNPAPAPAALWLPLLATFGLFLLRDGLTAARGIALSSDDRLLQNLNSSVAITAGFLVTARILPAELAAFWFWSGGIMLAVTVGWWRLGQPGSLVPVAACKAAGLLALGVVTEYDGHQRWLVLLVQAFVLLTAARVTGLRGLRVMMILLWGVSLGLLFWSTGRGQTLPLAGTLIHLGFSAVLLGYDQRWLGAGRGFSFVMGALLGLVAGMAGNVLFAAGGKPAAFMGLAALLALAGFPSRGWRGPAVAAGFMIAAAHLAMLGFRTHLHPGWWLWANEAVLLFGVGAIGFALARLPADKIDAGGWRFVQSALAYGGVVVLAKVFTMGLGRDEALAATAGAAVLLLGLIPWAQRWPLAVTATLGLVWGWLLHGPLQWRTGEPWLFAATAGAWALPVILQLSPVRLAQIVAPDNRRMLVGLQGVLATWITLMAVHANFTGPMLFAAIAGAALLVFVLAWRLGVRVALPASSVLLLAGALWAGEGLLSATVWLTQNNGWAVMTVLALAGVAGLLPLLARPLKDWADGWRRIALWAHGAGALLMLFWFFAAQRGSLAPYATVLWGVTAIGLFAVGLFARERVYRLLGLAGLALCIPRVFLVDIDSTLYRIVAFVVLGLVLLWVGFSYHRFRHLIADTDGTPEKAPAKTD